MTIDAGAQIPNNTVIPHGAHVHADGSVTLPSAGAAAPESAVNPSGTFVEGPAEIPRREPATYRGSFAVPR